MEYDNDRKIIHLYRTGIFFWIILVVLNPLVSTVTSFWFFPEFFIVLLFISLLLFPAYVLYAKYIVPGFLFEKRYVAFAMLSLVFFLLIQLLSTGIHKFILQFSLPLPEQFYLSYAPRTIVRDGLWTLINMFLCVIFCFFKNKSEDQKLIAELQSNNTLYRLKFLQSQLNPHFLFNALNSIYALCLQKSDKAADVVVRLADMMRYLIDDCSKSKIALDKEIEFIRSYIEVEKTRYEADIRFTIEGETKGIMIEPFLFISFIENGFKHAMSEDCRTPFIYITIKVSKERIELNVVNNTNIDLETQAKRINGTGIKNSRSLLEILYPESYALHILQTDILPRQKSLLRIKHAKEHLKMFYPDAHTLDVILNNNAFTVSLVVNPHAS